MKLNTSNEGKFEEFKRLFAAQNIDLAASHIDLEEIDADPISVVAHKATQVGEGIIVEDTSLDIDGESVGTNVRWLLDNLSDYIGKKATWNVLLAYQSGDNVIIFQGTIHGTIVKPEGNTGFGFDPLFLPNGTNNTLAQSKPDEYNARAKAVQALINNQPTTTHPLIKNWQGPWQH